MSDKASLLFVKKIGSVDSDDTVPYLSIHFKIRKMVLEKMRETFPLKTEKFYFIGLIICAYFYKINNYNKFNFLFGDLNSSVSLNFFQDFFNKTGKELINHVGKIDSVLNNESGFADICFSKSHEVLASNDSHIKIHLDITDGGSICGCLTIPNQKDAWCFTLKKHFEAHIDLLIKRTLESKENPIMNNDFLTCAEKRNALQKCNESDNNSNICQLIMDIFENKKDNIAISFQEEKITYQALQISICKLIEYFEVCGIAKGDRVAFFLEKNIEMFVCIYALIFMGAVYVPLNYVNDNKPNKKSLIEKKVKFLITDKEKSKPEKKILFEIYMTKIKTVINQPITSIDYGKKLKTI